MYIIDTSSGAIHCFENYKVRLVNFEYWSCLKSFEALMKTIPQSGKNNWLIVVFIRPRIYPHPSIWHWSFRMFLLSNSFSSLAYSISNQYSNNCQQILTLKNTGLRYDWLCTLMNIVTYNNIITFKRNFWTGHIA